MFLALSSSLRVCLRPSMPRFIVIIKHMQPEKAVARQLLIRLLYGILIALTNHRHHEERPDFLSRSHLRLWIPSEVASIFLENEGFLN